MRGVHGAGRGQATRGGGAAQGGRDAAAVSGGARRTGDFRSQAGRAYVSLWHDNQGRLRPGWSFLLGLIVAVIANYLAIGVAGPLSHGKMRLLEAMYRPLTMVF